MPTFEKGDMWDVFGKTDLFVITGNSYIKNDGSVVMSRGIALKLKNSSEGIDKLFGRSIRAYQAPKIIYNFRFRYGLVIVPFTKSSIGMLQIRYHFREQADISLIRFSLSKLGELAFTFSDKRFDVNFPGIGYGRLPREKVLPLVNNLLPDNVHVWEKEQN